jgi:hypothetical protein
MTARSAASSRWEFHLDASKSFLVQSHGHSWPRAQRMDLEQHACTWALGILLLVTGMYMRIGHLSSSADSFCG